MPKGDEKAGAPGASLRAEAGHSNGRKRGGVAAEASGQRAESCDRIPLGTHDTIRDPLLGSFGYAYDSMFMIAMSDIFSEVKSLDLPSGHYAVVGSGVLAAHGIRGYNDIDLLVTQTLYDKLKGSGWQERAVRPDFVVIEKDRFEASPHMMWLPTYRPDTDELIKHAEVLHGVMFARLSDVLDFKRAMGRPKDLEDIGLIERYITKHNT